MCAISYFVLLICGALVSTDAASTTAAPTCEGGLTWQECASTCPNMCGETPTKICTKICVQKCACESHQWQNGTKCYNQPTVEGECAPPPCYGDLVYNNCGTACENECGKLEAEVCTEACVPGCQCLTGQWKQGNNCYANSTACPLPECLGNTTYQTCGTACEKKCGKPAPEMCTFQCVLECQCKLSQWRYGNSCYDTEEECPEETQCNGDLVYTECGTSCEKICGEEPPEACTLQCVIGCQCKLDQWREGDYCFDKSSDCPACTGDLTYTTCGTACEQKCGEEKSRICTSECVEGCQCNSNQWRYKDNCYDNSTDCPPECPGDTKYQTCGTACEKMCGQPKPEMCTYQCVLNCQCESNQWRHGNNCYDNENDCPSNLETSRAPLVECEGDLVYQECGTACENMCGEEKPEICTLQCVLECQCEFGKWRNGTRCFKDETCAGFKTVINFITFVTCFVFTLYSIQQ